MSKYIFLDIETTGFSREWDYIIEIAAVSYDTEAKKILNSFHEYIKPGKSIPAKITEITGITNAKVYNCRNEESVLTDFVEWVFLENADAAVGHNIKSFDNHFIWHRCERYKIPMYEIELIDTLNIARNLTKQNKLPVLNHKQPTLAEYFGIQYQAHSAVDDVGALIQIFEKLTTEDKIKEKRRNLGF